MTEIKRNTSNDFSLLAVAGNPILHSKSPLIFNTAFNFLEQNAVYGRLAASCAEEVIFLFKELGLLGMNVTAPFKKSIMAYLDSIDDAALSIGGVNTVTYEGNRLKGYNTDYTGVTKSLKDHGICLKSKRCLVLGAGGAGRAAAYGLIKENADVTVVNRTYEKARLLADSMGCMVGKIESLEALLKNAEILVSTLSSSIDLIPVEWLPAGLIVLDANYKYSPLSQKAISKGLQLLKGEEWLLNQAIPAYNHFFNSAVTAGTSSKLMIFPADLIKAIKTTTQKGPRYLRVKDKGGAKNISLVGFMGSGKSFIGQMLARKMDLDFCDLDLEIEKRAGCSIPEFFETSDEAAFRVMEKEVLKDKLTNGNGVVFSCGGGAVLNGENREILKENSLVAWLYTSIKTTLKRIPAGSRPLLDCPDPGQKAREILNNRLTAYARSADLIVSSDKAADEVVENIYEEIAETFGN
ncbi:MAG: hypothetical protein GY757_28270 [bacterium]|nr:hypothetical protein [bacterium]